jgi:hypothetical protein
MPQSGNRGGVEEERKRGEKMGKGHGMLNTVQILCAYVCKWKK